MTQDKNPLSPNHQKKKKKKKKTRKKERKKKGKKRERKKKKWNRSKLLVFTKAEHFTHHMAPKFYS